MAVAPAPKPAKGKEVGERREPSPTQTANVLPPTSAGQKQDDPTTPRKFSLPVSHPRQNMEPTHSPTPTAKIDCTTAQTDESASHQAKRKRDGGFSDANEDSQSQRPVKAGRYFGSMMLDAFETEFDRVHNKAEEQEALCSTIVNEQIALRSALDEEAKDRKQVNRKDRQKHSEHIQHFKGLRTRIEAAEATTSKHEEQLASFEEALSSKASHEALEDYVTVSSTKLEELESIIQEKAKHQSTEEEIRKLVQNECSAAQSRIGTSSAELIKVTSGELEKRIEDVHKKTRDDAILARTKEFALDTRMNGYDASLQTIHSSTSVIKSNVDLYDSQLVELKKNNILDAERMDKLEKTQKSSSEAVKNLRNDIMTVLQNLKIVREDISPLSSQLAGHTSRLEALDGPGALAKLEKFFEDRMMEAKEELKTGFERHIKKIQKQHDFEKASLLQHHESEKSSQQAAMQAMQDALRRDKAALEEIVRIELKAQREKDRESAKATSKKAEKIELAAWKRLEKSVSDSCLEVENLKMGFQDDHTTIQHLQRTVETSLKGSADVSALKTNVKKLASGHEKLVKDVIAHGQHIIVVEQNLSTSVANMKEEFSTSLAANLSASVMSVRDAVSTSMAHTKQDVMNAIQATDRCADQRCSDRTKEVKEGLEELSNTVSQVNGAYQALQMGLGGFMGTPLRSAAYPSPPPQSHPNSPALQVTTTLKKNPHTPCGPRPSQQQQFQQSPLQLLSPASPQFAQASPLSNAPATNQHPGAHNMNNRPQATEHRRTNSVPQVAPQHVLPSDTNDATFNARQMQPPSPYMGPTMQHPRPGPQYRQ